ncbi:MAG: hypothetical protein Q9168_002668 [Polycauliona sp. 1 TL-2023]
MAPKTITVPIPGKLFWKQLWYRNNTSNPEGQQVETSKEKIVRNVSISEFNESIKSTVLDTKQSSSASATVGASYGPVSASVTATASYSKEITDTFIGTIRQQKDISINEEFSYEHTYIIAGNGKLGLYQAFFSAPGMEVSLTNTVTNEFQPPAEDIEIKMIMEEKRFLSDIQVVYTDSTNNKPFDNIREYTGQNEDINSGFGGKYVWLKPIYTNQVSQALTEVRIAVVDKEVPGSSDLAKGAKGKFRYLQFNKDANNDRKIVGAALLRSAGQAMTIKGAPGYDVITGDINQGRKGDFLYLVFQVQQAYAIEHVA